MSGLVGELTSGQTPSPGSDTVRVALYRANNFDLIRLLAAAQVAVMHLIEHLRIDAGWLAKALGVFPGVPIFFVVSGFLVGGSLERSSSLATFFRNRLLRVFPGLWACLAVSIALAAPFVDVPWLTTDFAVWLGAQLTLFQFYNPDFFRSFGVGVLNGSLWTIPVEVQFYLALPLIYLATRRLGHPVLTVIFVVSLGVHAWFLHDLYGTRTLVAKLAQVSLLPWLGLFLVGVIARLRWRDLEWLFRGRFVLWLAAYCAGTLCLSQLGLSISGNAINTISAVGLGGVVRAAAHTRPELSHHLLGGNDISYGLYLYHGPFMNVAVAMQLSLAPVVVAVLVMLATLAVASLSWRLVERPALGLKVALASARPQVARAMYRGPR